MALIKCSNCEKEYTDSLKACPHCGFCKVTEPSELETVTQTKTCQECGAKVAVDVKSCSYCGNTFEEPENAEDSKGKKNSQPLEQQVLDSLPLVSLITSAISCGLPFSGPISISELSLIESQLTMLIDNPNAMINLHQVPDEIKNVVMNKATMYKLLSAVQIRIATYYSDSGHIEESRKYLSQGRKSIETSEIQSFDSTHATPSPSNSDNSFGQILFQHHVL